MTDLQEQAVTLLDELHAEMNAAMDGGELEYEDVYNRIGVIIAMLRDGYNPNDGDCDHDNINVGDSCHLCGWHRSWDRR